MPELQYKTKDVPAFIKAFDEEQGILKGYAAIMGFPDSYGDIIEPGAFKRTLKENKGRIALCWQHNWKEPIGKPHVLKEHDRDRLPEELLAKFPKATGGLYFESKIVDTRQGKDAKELIRHGVLDEMSIGYDLYEGGQTRENGYNRLTDIILYEISPVTMAAMPAAMITDYKGLKIEETEDYIRIPIEGVSCEITATIDINKEKGIKALYCGKEKKVRTLLFAKDKGWTIESAKKWYEEHKEDFKDMEIELETKGAISYQSAHPNGTPKAPEDAEWDGPREVAAAEVGDLKVMCAYVMGDGDKKGDYKLPHHKAKGHAVVWRGVANAAARLPQTNIDAASLGGVKAHLSKHYKEFDKESPWEKAARIAGLCENLKFDEANELIKELAGELGFLASRLSVSEKEALALRIRMCEVDLEAL